MKRLFLVLLLLFMAIGTATAAQKLTYVDLVNRLTDLKALAVLPAPGEKCAQYSSYDRGSYYDEAAGKYAGWGANGDGGGIIRTENDMSVMAEINGPGCIWRIWSAAPGEGNVKIYLDGSAKPVLDMPFKDYFDSTKPPFNYPALVHTVAMGWNNYVPIPFQQSCKIVADKNWGNYYQFTYSTFPQGTIVPAFNPNLKPEETAALAAANKALSDNLGNTPYKSKSNTALSTSLTLKAETSETIKQIKGQGAITAIRIEPGA